MCLSFNLIDQPWIPCISQEGQPQDLSLRDVFARAPDLREIRDNSPLVTAALHRFLLAILHRNFGPEDEAAWAKLWKAERFDTPVLDAYFAQWHNRFDLYDDRAFDANAPTSSVVPPFDPSAYQHTVTLRVTITSDFFAEG